MRCPTAVDVLDPCPVGVSDLATHVRCRFDVPLARATNAVWHCLHSLSLDPRRNVDVADLSAWDVMYVMDILSDSEWTEF